MPDWQGGFLEVIENDVIGRIVGLTDFLQDDLTFAFKFLRIQCGVLQDVGNHINRQFLIFVQDLAIIGRVLARGIGIHLPANCFDFFRNLKCGTTTRTLERHMFKHMGNAVDVWRLVTRPNINPCAQGNRLYVIQTVGRDNHSIVKPGELDCHIALLLFRISGPIMACLQAARRFLRTCAIKAATSLDMGSTFSGRSYRSDRRGGKSG